jgi:hypothetical protein
VLVGEADLGGVIHDLRFYGDHFECTRTTTFPRQLREAVFDELGRLIAVGERGLLVVRTSSRSEFETAEVRDVDLRSLALTGLPQDPLIIGTGNGEVLLGAVGGSPFETHQVFSPAGQNDVDAVGAFQTSNGVELWAARDQISELAVLTPGSLNWQRADVFFSSAFGDCLRLQEPCVNTSLKRGPSRLLPWTEGGVVKGFIGPVNECSIGMFLRLEDRCVHPILPDGKPGRVASSGSEIENVALSERSLFLVGSPGLVYEARLPR